jgi:hypothetical protein
LYTGSAGTSISAASASAFFSLRGQKASKKLSSMFNTN